MYNEPKEPGDVPDLPALEIFCCYARKDQLFMQNLKTHLTPLQREGLIKLWSDTDINAGNDWEAEIQKHLDTAQMILLLVSPDFIASDYCYSKEMTWAMARHERQEARVVPIILRPTHWKSTPFATIQALPTDAKPITKWESEDDALYDVVEHLALVVEELRTQQVLAVAQISDLPLDPPSPVHIFNDAPPPGAVPEPGWLSPVEPVFNDAPPPDAVPEPDWLFPVEPAPVQPASFIADLRFRLLGKQNQYTQPQPQSMVVIPSDQQLNARTPIPYLDVAQLTDVGRKRPHNEDNMAYVIPKDPQAMARKGALFIVADGKSAPGRASGGELASEIVVDTVSTAYYNSSSDDPQSSLLQAVRQTNTTICQRAAAKMRYVGMSSTCVAAAVRGKLAYIANVGNSRAYLVRRSRIRQISQDHSRAGEQIRDGLLSAEQARTHQMRYVLTRTLGIQPDIDIDLFCEVLEEGDTLILCTDGLWDAVDDREILRIIDPHVPQESIYHLVEQANENGGPDNITVIVVRVQEFR